MEKITKEDIENLESVILDAQSYYHQPSYYDHCASLDELSAAENKVYRALRIINVLENRLNGKMRIFRVKMSCDDVNDSFYFNDLPSREDVLSAIKANANLAPEYEWFYANLKKAAEMFSWPECWSSNMSETGNGIRFDGQKCGPSDVYIRIKHCHIIEVENG